MLRRGQRYRPRSIFSKMAPSTRITRRKETKGKVPVWLGSDLELPELLDSALLLRARDACCSKSNVLCRLHVFSGPASPYIDVGSWSAEGHHPSTTRITRWLRPWGKIDAVYQYVTTIHCTELWSGVALHYRMRVVGFQKPPSLARSNLPALGWPSTLFCCAEGAPESSRRARVGLPQKQSTRLLLDEEKPGPAARRRKDHTRPGIERW